MYQSLSHNAKSIGFHTLAAPPQVNTLVKIACDLGTQHFLAVLSAPTTKQCITRRQQNPLRSKPVVDGESDIVKQ
jgi:hypothetical protein